MARVVEVHECNERVDDPVKDLQRREAPKRKKIDRSTVFSAHKLEAPFPPLRLLLGQPLDFQLNINFKEFNSNCAVSNPIGVGFHCNLAFTQLY